MSISSGPSAPPIPPPESSCFGAACTAGRRASPCASRGRPQSRGSRRPTPRFVISCSCTGPHFTQRSRTTARWRTSSSRGCAVRTSWAPLRRPREAEETMPWIQVQSPLAGGIGPSAAVAARPAGHPPRLPRRARDEGVQGCAPIVRRGRRPRGLRLGHARPARRPRGPAGCRIRDLSRLLHRPCDPFPLPPHRQGRPV